MSGNTTAGECCQLCRGWNGTHIVGCASQPTQLTGIMCAPNPTYQPMPQPCQKCGWSHTSTMCLAPMPGYPRALSDADVERIARRVAELLKETP